MIEGGNDVEVIELDSSSEDDEMSPDETGHATEPKPLPQPQQQPELKVREPITADNERLDSRSQDPEVHDNLIDSLLNAYEKCYEKLNSMEMSMNPQQLRRWLHLYNKTAARSDQVFSRSYAEDNRFPQSTPYQQQPPPYQRYPPSRPTRTYRPKPKPKKRKAVRKKPSPRKSTYAPSKVSKTMIAQSRAKMTARAATVSASASASSSSTATKTSVTPKSEKKPVIKKERTSMVKVKSERS